MCDELFTFAGGEFLIKRGESLGEWASGAVGDGSTINFADPGEFAHGAGGEDFAGAVDLGHRDIAFGEVDAVRSTQIEDGAAGDTFGASDEAACQQGRFALARDDEDMGCVGFSQKALFIEHDCIVCTGIVGFDLGENGLDEVAMVDLGVEAIGRESAGAGGDETEPFVADRRAVDRGFVFGEDDEGRSGLVEAWVHAAGDFDTAGECEADVDAVVHVVGFEGFADLVGELFVRGDLGERQGLCTRTESIEMLAKFEDAARIDAESFPDRVPPLDG